MSETILSTCYASTESLGVSEWIDTNIKSFGVPGRISCAVESTNFTTILFTLPHIMAPKFENQLPIRHGVIAPRIKRCLTHWGRVQHYDKPSLVQIMAFRLFGAKSSEPMLAYRCIWKLSIETLGTNFSEILIKIKTFSFEKIAFENVICKWCPFYLCLNAKSPKAWLVSYPHRCRPINLKET